jgi:Flp pilus assembly protein TadG
MECKGTSQKRAARTACLSKDAGAVRSFRSAEDGATLVEMALASSILFSVVFGIIIMSLGLYSYDFVADAARMGARYAMVRGSYCTGYSDCGVTEAQIQTYVRGLAYPGINPNNLTVTAAWYNVNRASGTTTTISLCANSNPTNCNVPGKNTAEVKVVYTYPLNIPFWRSTTLSMSSISQLLITQ